MPFRKGMKNKWNNEESMDMAQAELALLMIFTLQDEEPHNAQPAHRDWELPAVRTLQIYVRDQTGQRKSMQRVSFC